MTPGPTIGVDVGGTTTEVVRLDRGAVTEVRTTSTTVDPAGLGAGVLAAIAAARDRGLDPEAPAGLSKITRTR